MYWVYVPVHPGESLGSDVLGAVVKVGPSTVSGAAEHVSGGCGVSQPEDPAILTITGQHKVPTHPGEYRLT